MAALNVLFIDDIFGRHFFVDFYYAKEPVRNMILDFGSIFARDMLSHNIMNVMLLFPAGCFAYYLYKPLRNPFMFAYIFIVTDICIEALQFVFAIGVFDITDLITNLFGVALAYISCLIVDRFYRFKNKENSDLA
jgi:glycopeptide antibiotics resistance protein